MKQFLPASRTSQQNENPETVFQKKNEVFCSHFRTDNTLICIQKKTDFPTKVNADCLHCGEKIIAAPFPAVKYHDPIIDKYFVFGYFCRPCCSLAHVRDEVRDPRAILWTQIILKKYFDIHHFNFAPPRRSLLKYGGNMSLHEFYGEDENITTYKDVHSFPFVTFSMYAEVIQNNDVRGLRRPTVRTEPIREQEQTEKPPLILEYLATKKNKVDTVKRRKKNTDTPNVGSLLNYIVK